MRDGNQAIVDPMDAVKKHRFFDLLVEIGVKEIEIGFPAAGQTEFDFIQGLVRSGTIPEDVTVQVLTQAREDLIKRSFESLEGARSAIVHVYNALSPAWREIVFRMTREEVKQIAINAAKLLRDEAAKRPDTDWYFEYSPETFSTAELDFSLETCAAVMDVLQPTRERPLILNLPATVEAATPNVYADQIEYFCRNLPHREAACISLHTHNDRGTGVAAAELGLMAGADRIEGCLFGNGERTGNCCLVTVALNMYTQGIDPGLDFSDIDRIIERAPWRHMVVPGGYEMSVAMSNCGSYGWVADRAGYRYSKHDHLTDKPWPPMSELFLQLALDAAVKAGYHGFVPDACLINRYATGARMGLHQDKDEQDMAQPIVSISLGLPAIFQFGGAKRNDKVERILLENGDAVVWGGPDRLRYHGIQPLKQGEHPLTGPYRYNLTFRKAR